MKDSSFVYQNSLNATLFGRNINNVGVQGCEARIYYCQIYNNNNILRDYAPCYRKSDNKPGMYDLVNNVFYTNSGTGQFLIGNEIPRVNYNEKIDEVLTDLSDQEQQVLRMRFGLDDDTPKTLEEIGKVFGVTRERIRQIEAKAIRKLRHPSRLKLLKNFY